MTSCFCPAPLGSPPTAPFHNPAALRRGERTPPCSQPGFSQAVNNLEAPSINTRSGMPGAHSTRRPLVLLRRRDGAEEEEPHHELSRRLPGGEEPGAALPPLRRRPAAAAAAAASARRRRAAAPGRRPRLLRGGRAGGGRGEASGAARLRGPGLAAARPGGPTAGGGGYGAARGWVVVLPGSGGCCPPPRCDARCGCLSPQMCEKFTVCENSMEMLVQNNLNLPKVTEEDGCLLAGFDEEKCLKKLSSGLFTFQTYLEYVQETFTSEKQKVESLCYSTKHLATTIRQMVINPDEVVIPDSATQKSLLTKLKSDKTWIEKITTHLILRDFTSFMEKTVRAVRYLKNTRSVSV
uniref:Interleukin-6 n=1 Tax=Anas platyrhynchos platyrhynchos TaxID=8840 RepID=A0A493T445_ANAPP